MSDQISFYNNDETQDNIKKIMSHTNYSEEEAILKFKEFNCDVMLVIRDYIGIPEKKNRIKSVNQEIFKQIRTKLDISMKQYRDKNPINLDQVIENFSESDEREKMKNIKQDI